ncbi:hypothetical protein PF008_g9236 [Phytophthora fragariae]|uniref:Uncharacterized protein n=1 Tax=Phytophthora fragariae TaxID=53985 RepID=A0A6G0RXF2_9STRA|nr:hypothetical protein PF008_g9236 [Phytophthora fragariae]
MALLYEPFAAEDSTTKGAKLVTAAQDERSTVCGEQFVTVEHVSADHADLDAIPVNSPLFMISSSGSTLNTSETGSAFVKLNKSEDGLITIQRANDELKCLILNEYLQCVFGSADAALKFKMRLSKAGRLVLVERLSGCVLENEIQRRQKFVVCRNSYSAQSQSWLLFTTHTLVPSLTASNLQKTEYSPDGRRQLFMELAMARKLSRDVGEVIKLMYGSRVPTSIPNPTNEIRAERAQHILELLAGKVSMEYAGDFLEVMYGTSAPL